MKVVIGLMLLVGSSASAQWNMHQQRLGAQTFGSGNDTHGNSINTHSQQIGNVRFDSYDAHGPSGNTQTNCTTQTIGSQQFTNCY